MIRVLDAGKVIAAHTRAVGRYVQTLTLDHYLEVLARKPGALPGATVLAQASQPAAREVAEAVQAAGRRDPLDIRHVRLAY